MAAASPRYSRASSAARGPAGWLLGDRAVHPERRTRANSAGADRDPGQAAQDDARLAVRQPALLLHDREGADGRVLAVDPRHEQHLRPVVGAGLADDPPDPAAASVALAAAIAARTSGSEASSGTTIVGSTTSSSSGSTGSVRVLVSLIKPSSSEGLLDYTYWQITWV